MHSEAGKGMMSMKHEAQAQFINMLHTWQQDLNSGQIIEKER